MRTFSGRPQPRGSFSLNRGHWASSAMIAGFVGSRPNWEPVSNTTLTVSGSPGTSYSESGVGMIGGNTSNYYKLVTSPRQCPTKILIVSRVRYDNINENGVIVAKGDAGGAVFRLDVAGRDTIKGMAFYNGSWRQSSFATDIRTTGFRDIAGTYDGTDLNFYIDGTVDSTAAYTGSLVSSTAQFAFGFYNGRGFGGAIEYCFVFDGTQIPANAATVRELQRDPYALFSKPVLRYYSVPAGATGYGPLVGRSRLLLTNNVRTHLIAS